MPRARGLRKLTVEECFPLDSAELRRVGVLDAASGTRYTYTWRRTGGKPDCSITFKVLEWPGCAMALGLCYAVSTGGFGARQEVDYIVKVTSTRCTFGGRRIWLVCPVSHNGVPCGRRVLKLYLAAGTTTFACRECLGPTYKSCEQSDKGVSALARSPELLRIALRMGTVRQQLLACAAVNLIVKRAIRRSARRNSSRNDFIQRGVSMPRKGSSFYEREFVAAKSRILARMLAGDTQTAMAMDLIIVATQVGADIGRLAEKTSFTIEQIRPLESRLRQALIWNGRKADTREWLDISYDRQRMTIILAQALVARGFLKRQWTGSTAIYTDENDNVVARFCSCEPFVDCLESLLDLESHGPRTLLSSKW